MAHLEFPREKGTSDGRTSSSSHSDHHDTLASPYRPQYYDERHELLHLSEIVPPPTLHPGDGKAGEAAFVKWGRPEDAPAPKRATGERTVGAWFLIQDFFKGLSTPNQLAFLAVVLVQAAIIATLIAIIAGRVYHSPFASHEHLAPISAFLLTFLLANGFEILMSIDGLRTRNVFQMVFLRLFSAAMLIYGILMASQIRDALRADAVGNDCRLSQSPDDLSTCYSADIVFNSIQPLSNAIPIVIGVGTVILSFLTWRLWREFGWDMYKRIGASLELQRLYRNYSIYVSVSKFMLFFGAGYTLQLILIFNFRATESIITYIALPFTFLIILFGGVGVRREIKWLVYLLFLGELAGLAYFLYKLYGIASTWNSSLFVVPRHTLITFNLVCIVLLLFLGLSSGIVYSNFGRGLAERLPEYLPPMQTLGRKGSTGGEGTERMEMD